MNEVSGDVRFLILPATPNIPLESCIKKQISLKTNDDDLTNSLRVERQ